MRATTITQLTALALFATASAAFAQPEPAPTRDERKFGMEFEFAGRGNRITSFEEMPWENYEKLMRKVVEHYNADPATIRKVEFEKETSNLEKYPTGKRKLFRAEWKDPQGRTWLIEPEFVASTGYDGYELVTPPMTKPDELQEILKRIRDSKLVREGLKSGVHLTIDGKGLIKSNGDARALANLIMMHENNEPMLRRLFNPVRGGGHANRFARSLAVDHEDLLKEINQLRPEERTKAKLSEMFRAREAREMALHEVDVMDPNSMNKPWKYRAMNLAKILDVNNLHNHNAGVVEFRMFDLHALENPEVHRLEAELYRAMVDKAMTMANNGETVKYRPRATMPAGEDPGLYNTPSDPVEAKAKAREMIESLGLDPQRFEPLLESNVARHRDIRSATEFEGMLEKLPRGRVENNGKAFTYGFELEGSGDGFALIGRPKDADTNARWDSMSTAEKKAYYRQVVGENRNAVKTHFNLDTQKYPWLDGSWKVEGSGNWEVRSTVFESVGEATDKMRELKRLAGKSSKGFHLHMRDNGTDWDRLEGRSSEFADFVERSSNWIWLERARKLGTMTSMKSWSNARMNVNTIEALARMSPNNYDRATVRVQIPSNREYVDLEIRGFTLDVDNIERLAKIYTDGMKTGNYGPWRHDANPLAMNGQGDAPTSLRFVDHYKDYLERVEGRTMTPEEAKVMDGLQHEYGTKAKGRARTYATNVAAPLLPWDAEASLDESLRRDLKFGREAYLRSLRFTAGKVMSGEYGLDLSVANEAALEKHLGLTEAEAKAVVEYRRAGGKLANADDLVRAMARGADAGKMSRLNETVLKDADAETLRSRAGVPAGKVDAVIDFRETHDVLDALGKGGVTEARAMEMIDKSGGLDLESAAATKEKMVELLGVSEATAEKIIAFRDAHEINTVEDLKKAGLSDAEARKVHALAGTTIDLKTATADQLRGLGLTDAEVTKIVDARGGGEAYSRYTDVTRTGVSAEVAEKLKRANGINIEKLNTLTAEEISTKGGISIEDAKKIVAGRAGKNVNEVSVLRDVLGHARGGEIHGKTAAIDLATSSASALEARGISAEDAKKLVNYRDATKLGRGSYAFGDYNAETAANQLKEAGVLSEAEAEVVRIHSKNIDLEKITAEELKSRFGLSAENAEKVINYRDAGTLDLEGLKKAGLTEAEAKAVIEATRALDTRKASLKELMTRTGLGEAELIKMLRVDGVDLNSASAEDLKRRLGISAENAKKLVDARVAGNSLNSVDKLKEAGLSDAVAKKAFEAAKGVNLNSATPEELKKFLSEAEVRRLMTAREKAKNAPEVDANEIARQVRFKVKKWAKETTLSESLMRSLLPRPNPNATTVTAETATEGEGFGPRRTGRAGAVRESRISTGTASQVFEGIKAGTIDRLLERATAETDASTKKALEGAVRTARDMNLEVVKTNDILAEAKDGKVRVSTGLLNEIYLRSRTVPPAERGVFRMRVLGLIFGHEAAHNTGIRAETVADTEGLKIVERSALGTAGQVTQAELATALAAFNKPTGASHLDNFLSRMRNVLKYGTARGRLRNLERAAAGEADPLKKYRRADGTLEWKKLTADRALREGVGLAHFGLALFLKEVATVTATGDRARIEEFFDGLMTTDFYKHYGLFVAGARVGEVAYTRYLQRYVKPKFVNGLLKTNMVLAAGLALPMIVEGTFEGKAFVITLSSLGISSAAVHAASGRIKWLVSLKKAKDTGRLARLGLNAKRLARFGGWFYTAAELAVILYAAETIETKVHAYLDMKKAKADLAAAGRKFIELAGNPNTTKAELEQALDEYHEANIEYRNFLYGPLHMEEAVLAGRLEGLARRAKIKADERKATIDKIKKHVALRRNIERRHGSVENYAASLVRKAEAEIESEVNKFVQSYNLTRDKSLKSVYEDNKRGTDILKGVDHLDWLLAGGRANAPGDPFSGRSDVFANWGRDRAKGELEDALTGVSRNRIESYDDETRILEAVEKSLEDRGRTDLADLLKARSGLVKLLKAADQSLIQGNGSIDMKSRKGMTDRITGALEGE